MNTTPNPGPPKNFLLKCQKCCHARLTSGVASDLQGLHEYASCPTCGKIRTFRCPQCGGTMKMRRIKPNA